MPPKEASKDKKNDKTAPASDASKTESKGKKSRVLFSTEVSQDDRPVNIYRERVIDSETGNAEVYLWWTTHNGQEVGREEINKIDDASQIKTLLGYEYSIPFTPEAVAEVKKRAFGKTQFLHKDGEAVFTVKPENFIKPEDVPAPTPTS